MVNIQLFFYCAQEVKDGRTWSCPDLYQNNREEVQVTGNLRSSNGLALLSAALGDVGLIFVHEWMVRPQLAEGRLIRVLDDYVIKPTLAEAPIHVVFPSSRGLSLKVRTFVDFLVELFADPQT